MRVACDLARDGIRRRAIDVGHDDSSCPLATEPVTERTADAVATAGDDDDFAGCAHGSGRFRR
jgi:hypothetical protein